MTRKIAEKYQVIDFCCGHPFTHKDEIATWIAAFNEDCRGSLLVSVSNLQDGWRVYDDYWDGVLSPEQILRMSNAAAIKTIRGRTNGKKALMIFLFPPFSGPYRRIWRKFKSLGYETAFLYLGPPQPRSPVTGNLLLRDQIKKTIKKIFQKLILISPDVWIICGDRFRAAHRDLLIEKPDAKIVHAHSFDFERFRSMSVKKKPSEKAGYRKVIVLIDQGFTSHPDRSLIPGGDGISFEGTYRPLVDFLRHLGTICAATIKVAAHPKASLAETIKIFSDFEVLRGDTMEMISAADLVVTHSSTAIQWAVFFNKPIALFSTAELDKSRLGPTAANFARQLNISNVDLSQGYEGLDEKVFQLDQARFADYVQNYVKGAVCPDISLKEHLLSSL